MSINQASLVILATLSLSFTCIVSDRVDWIPAVCPNATDDGGFCNQILSTNCSTTSRYDLKLMGKCITALALNATKNAKLVLSSHSGLLKIITGDCPESFDDALDNLKDCASDVKNISKKGPVSINIIADLKAKGSGAMTDLNTCKDDLPGGATEPEKQNGDAGKKLEDAIDELNVAIAYAIEVIGVLLRIANTIEQE